MGRFGKRGSGARFRCARLLQSRRSRSRFSQRDRLAGHRSLRARLSQKLVCVRSRSACGRIRVRAKLALSSFGNPGVPDDRLDPAA
jgi:hypothetical protein